MRGPRLCARARATPDASPMNHRLRCSRVQGATKRNPNHLESDTAERNWEPPDTRCVAHRWTRKRIPPGRDSGARELHCSASWSCVSHRSPLLRRLQVAERAIQPPAARGACDGVRPGAGVDGHAPVAGERGRTAPARGARVVLTGARPRESSTSAVAHGGDSSSLRVCDLRASILGPSWRAVFSPSLGRKTRKCRSEEGP